jgi:hypothetical protein
MAGREASTSARLPFFYYRRVKNNEIKSTIFLFTY